MPLESRAFRKFHLRLVALLVEEAYDDFLGDLAVNREICSYTIKVGAERVRLAGPDLHSRNLSVPARDEPVILGF
jgi:hypothetical protein